MTHVECMQVVVVVQSGGKKELLCFFCVPFTFFGWKIECEKPEESKKEKRGKMALC